MKELSIEEKAKRYDEAIERVKNIKTGKYETTFIFTEGLFEHIFPELAELEDERIRKQISSFLKEFEHDHYRSLDFSSWIAWLEKQGKQSSNILWHDVSEEPDEKREIFCEWKNSTGTWHSVVFYYADSKAFFDGEGMVQNVVKWTYVNKMLEKQGEQKSINDLTQQDVRERAAIAAMQGVMNFFGSIDYNRETIAELAVKQADALVEKLKGE